MNILKNKPVIRGILVLLAISAMLAGQCRAGEEDDLRFAVGAYNDGFYDMAARGFNDFVDKYPYSDQRAYALYLLGVSQFAQKKYDAAKGRLAELTTLYPKYERLAEAHYFLGEASYLTNDYKTAWNSYKYVYKAKKDKDIAKDISDEAVLFRLGELDFEFKDFTGAKKVLLELRKNYKNYENMDIVRFYLSLSYYYTKEYGRALKEFKYILTKPNLSKDNLIDIFFFTAHSAFMVEQYDTASKYFLKFLGKTKKDKRREAARYYNAMSYYFSKNKEGALKELKRYYDDYPKGENIKDVTEQLAQLYFELNSFEKANVYFTRLIQKYGDSPKVDDWRLQSAWCYTRTNNYEKAAAIYEKLESATKDEAFKDDIRYLRAESYFIIKEYFKALKIYEVLKEKVKYKKDALVKLADSHFYLDDYYMSAKYYLSFIKQFPGFVNNHIYLNLAVSLQEEQKKSGGAPDFGEALKYYEKVIANKSEPELYKTALYNAAILYDAGNDAGNLKRVLRAYIDLKDDDTPPYFYLKLANAYFVSDELDNAAKLYKYAIKTNIPGIMGESLFKLGEIYYKQSKLTESLEYFELAGGTFSSEGDQKGISLLQIKKGNIYEKLDRWGQAKTEYLKVIDTSKDEKLISIAKQRLKEVEKRAKP